MENNAAQLNADISALISTIPDALNLLSTPGHIPTVSSFSEFLLPTLLFWHKRAYIAATIQLDFPFCRQICVEVYCTLRKSTERRFALLVHESAMLSLCLRMGGLLLTIFISSFQAKSSALSTGDLPLLMSTENLNTMSALSFLMLQQQQMQLMGMNPFVFGSMPNGIQGFSGLDALNLAVGGQQIQANHCLYLQNLARPASQSAIPSPKQSVSSDMRPRAFSSAATLQPSMVNNQQTSV